ncbi:Crp/Fnr family transcriptional regulator [Niastella yeongjuensis]|uniref:Crp/Fnr family transcriptional regulator n=1 Tax=Niastella yeongjuensis TaxID=354355 RepID=A0A1V9F3E6_9BACT|nr:Crp/Fnr family transcriptional regulator [Niastella yeongjuensis]OQP52765.1 Crp/Fnr family transcriptional regulator [Niastella yeongjuensis]SEP19172.1 cAMP-binding domain of CRP or a regulatory subunit of cAMP-dependent protein kinases [Niastella yeongjuensis]
MQLPSYYQRLSKKYPLVTAEEWEMLDIIATVRYIRKGEDFLRYGKIARYSAFVLIGQFKFSLVNDEGAEKIVKFAFTDDFLANCESFHKKAPSNVCITALEDSVILRINTKKLQPLYDHHRNLLHVNLQLYQELMEQQAEHQYILSLKSPIQRYRFLLEHRPAIIEKISLTNIARYLYISREALSRARILLSGRKFCD